MPNFEVLEPAIDPNNRISFLLDWELTMKCNLDCSYCATGLYGGHDNSIPHPKLEDCLRTIDFMFAYVDLYMQHKPKGIRTAVLNVYGGESLAHPNIVEILSTIRDRHRPYANRWALTVTTTTNAIISTKTLAKIIPLIDEFTVSYHSENTAEQKEQFKKNLLDIKAAGRRLKCVVLMHNKPELFAQSQEQIEWLNQHEINILPRQLDVEPSILDKTTIGQYNEQQVTWFDSLYKSRSYRTSTTISGAQQLTGAGRACCGGRQLCENKNYKDRQFYVLDNSFTDWYCSVNWFFLYIKQVNGEVYFNKDCKMNFNREIAPIGNLSNPGEILATLANQLDTGIMPIVQCKKSICFCGLCAPKAQDLNTYHEIISKYQL